MEPIIAREIDTLTIDNLQTVVNEQSTSYYTARDMKSLLSHLYKRAMANNGGNGTVTVNLSRFIVLPELVEKEPEPFTEQEVNAMWKAWDNGKLFVGYMLLMIYTSMMPGELFACKSDMIDYDKHEIYGCGRKTKKRKDTPIVFPVFMSPVIKRLAESASPETNLLYSGYENKFYDDYHATIKELGVRDLPPIFLPPHHGHGSREEGCGTSGCPTDHASLKTCVHPKIYPCVHGSSAQGSKPT